MLVDRIETVKRSLAFNVNNTPINLYFGSGLPDSPANGDLWFEPNALYPQPWTYDSAESEWLSAPFLYDWGAADYNNTGSVEKAIPFYGVAENKIKMRQIIGFVRNNSGTAHSSTDYLNFSIDSLFGTGTYTTMYNIAVNTGTVPNALNGNGVRRILENPEVWIPGNAWTLRLFINENGAIPGTTRVNFAAYLQYSRS